MFCARFDLADVQLVIVAIVTNAEMDEPLALLARNSLSESRFRRDLGVAAGAANFVWGSGGHLESLRLVSSDNDVMMIGPGFLPAALKIRALRESMNSQKSTNSSSSFAFFLGFDPPPWPNFALSANPNACAVPLAVSKKSSSSRLTCPLSMMVLPPFFHRR